MTTISADTLPDALSAPARDFISQSHRLLIGAERPDAADGRTFATLDPSTGREIAQVAHAGAEDVARAVMFFTDRDNSFITGQVLYVCGGTSVASTSF